MKKLIMIIGIAMTFGCMALNGAVIWKITNDKLLTGAAAIIPWVAACGAGLAVAGSEEK